ncbi:MAG: histidine triad nucleotide-binding protein [Bacillota bacterium]|nr:histidine triad nucleotide-binding protein [Bacillota bacterium]
MENCIFCKIVNGEIPSDRVYEDEYVISIKDIKPEAPIHVLIMPKKHINSINDVKEEDLQIISHIFKVAQKIAKQLGVAESGYRIITNCGKDGGQTVEHLHFHLLGGKSLPISIG